ncbi:hypothetical protein AC579_3168 [Pseudocercospora musae]|uniref:Pre-rRNA-processing protein n=1 Tax=Pseudocercospora musae TaxID=113226 RepID=A0A139IEA5_9PEZI|nr:hypothetical protein AC579_3168 [Pseudocercospora musae]
MGSSAKKKKEKKADFQKAKLKVGKARPKNTNATDTSFQAKSIVLKQQKLSEGSRDATTLFDHNLSLLSSKTDVQRRDALIYLTTAMAASTNALLRPASQILEKAQPLMLDGSSSVRSQLLKLFRLLPANQLGDLSRTLLFARTGMTHLSHDIRLDALDFFDWLMQTNGEVAVSMAGGWVKTLRTFQTVLSWQDAEHNAPAANGNWSAAKSKSNMGSNKLLVRQLNSLSRLLTVGLKRPTVDWQAQAMRAAELFPLWQTDAHMVAKKSNPYGYLNLFGASRDVDSEVYDDAEERANVFVEVGLDQIFRMGVQEAKKEGGEYHDLGLPSHIMASLLDALLPIKDKASMCMALKCTDGELLELKKAVKFEMAREVYDGQALLGVTNFREFDPYHKHRDEVQRRVAESDPVAQEIFEGSRWPAAERAAYQRGPLVKVLDFIIRQLSAMHAQYQDRKEGKRIRRRSRNSFTDSDKSSPVTEKQRSNKRTKIILSYKHDRPWFITCAPSKRVCPAAVPRERSRMPAQSQVTAGQAEEIEDTPQRDSKRQRLSLQNAVRKSRKKDRDQEETRSHRPTPSALTCPRQVSISRQPRPSSPDDLLPEIVEASLPFDVELQTEPQRQSTPTARADMVIKEEESSEPTSANFPANSLAAQLQNTIFQLVDARVDSRKLEVADELHSMIDQSIQECVAEALASKEKEMEERITAHVMAELIEGFSGSAA